MCSNLFAFLRSSPSSYSTSFVCLVCDDMNSDGKKSRINNGSMWITLRTHVQQPNDKDIIIHISLSSRWKIQCEKNEFRFFQLIGFSLWSYTMAWYHIICANCWTMNDDHQYHHQLNDHIIGFYARVFLLRVVSSTNNNEKNPTPFEMQTKNHIHKNRRCLWHQTPLTLGSCSLARHQISICIFIEWFLFCHSGYWLWIVKNRKWA